MWDDFLWRANERNRIVSLEPWYPISATILTHVCLISLAFRKGGKKRKAFSDSSAYHRLSRWLESRENCWDNLQGIKCDVCCQPFPLCSQIEDACWVGSHYRNIEIMVVQYYYKNLDSWRSITCLILLLLSYWKANERIRKLCSVCDCWHLKPWDRWNGAQCGHC